jgi:hypothetical protein
MAEFLVEIYVSRRDGGAFESSAAKARLAAEELTREGTPVRYLNSIFVPEDETCFFLYQAVSADAVCEAARRAALPFERVSEAVTGSKGDQGRLRG